MQATDRHEAVGGMAGSYTCSRAEWAGELGRSRPRLGGTRHYRLLAPITPSANPRMGGSG